MKKRIILACVVTLIGAAVVVLAQVQQRPPAPAQGNPPASQTMFNGTLTPEQKARLVRTARLMNAAFAAAKVGDYAEAEINARQSIATGHDPGFSLEILASSLYMQGKTQEALQTYKILSDSGDVNDELPYSLLLLKSGHWSEAVVAFNKQLIFDSDGDLLRDYGFTEDDPRPQDLETAIEIGMGLDTGWFGYHGSDQDRKQQSLAHFQRALALEPDSAIPNYYYGYAMRGLHRQDLANVAFEKAMSLDQGDVGKAAEEALQGRR